MMQAVKQIYAVQLLRMEKIMKKNPKIGASLHFAQFIITRSWRENIVLYKKQIDCPEFLQGFTNKQTHSSVEHPSPAWWPLAAGHGSDAVRTRTHVFLNPERYDSNLSPLPEWIEFLKWLLLFFSWSLYRGRVVGWETSSPWAAPLVLRSGWRPPS